MDRIDNVAPRWRKVIPQFAAESCYTSITTAWRRVEMGCLDKRVGRMTAGRGSEIIRDFEVEGDFISPPISKDLGAWNGRFIDWLFKP